VGHRQLLIAAAAAALAALGPVAAPAAGATGEIPCFEAPPVDSNGHGLRLKLLATRSRELTYVTAEPGSTRRLFVVERAGRIWRMSSGGRFSRRPFLDLSAAIEPTIGPEWNNERGMQSVAFPPDYARSRRFYVFLTDAHGDTRVMRFRAAPDGRRALAGSGRTLLFVEHSFAKEHYGGQVAVGPRGRVYVSLGDAVRAMRAQTSRRYGQILSLDPRHPRRRPRILAKGLRNPFRFSFDHSRRRLIVGDVGEASYEEVDVLRPSRRTVANLGWPYYEGRLHHPGPHLRHYVAPRLVYAHSHRNGTAVIGGRIVRDPRLAWLRGRYVFGDLCRGWIATARLGGGQRTIRRTGLLLGALTSFGEDAAGRLYLTSQHGTVHRLDPAEPSGSG
jgi:glucose/arabinose dehydrogenase